MTASPQFNGPVARDAVVVLRLDALSAKRVPTAGKLPAEAAVRGGAGDDVLDLAVVDEVLHVRVGVG